jgi:hypothetical protein
MEQYDLEALYLYNDGYSYRVGKISKVNDKSIRMEGGRKILKEEFPSIHKLTDEEVAIFNKEVVRKLSNSISSIRSVLEQ